MLERWQHNIMVRASMIEDGPFVSMIHQCQHLATPLIHPKPVLSLAQNSPWFYANEEMRMGDRRLNETCVTLWVLECQ